MNAQSQQMAAAQQLAASGGAGATESKTGGNDEDDIPELEAVEDDGPVDETGVDAKDIELVIAQVNCSRAKAVKALKDSGGDLINASKLLSSFVSTSLLKCLQLWRLASSGYFDVFSVMSIKMLCFPSSEFYVVI
jgi:NACalpha-BTF3-like transcription factor